MSDIYSLDFEPNKIAHQQEELGLIFADEDTAVQLMKEEKNMIVAELTVYYSQNTSYKNTSELNAHIYSDKRFKDFAERFGKTLKSRNRSKIRYETYKTFREDLRTKVVNERELVKRNL